METELMLFNAYKRYNYQVDIYGYILITSADGTVTTRQYDVVPTTHNVQIATSFIGDLIILSNSKFQKNAYIQNLRDRNGNEIYPDGIWQISSTQPVTNALGLVEGYKYKAKIIDGEV
jgi:hypothetical protein